MHYLKNKKNYVIYYDFFSKYVFGKKNVFWPKIASVTLHIAKEFWWHRIFGSATIFWVRKCWSTWSREGGGGYTMKYTGRKTKKTWLHIKRSYNNDNSRYQLLRMLDVLLLILRIKVIRVHKHKCRTVLKGTVSRYSKFVRQKRLYKCLQYFIILFIYVNLLANVVSCVYKSSNLCQPS